MYANKCPNDVYSLMPLQNHYIGEKYFNSKQKLALIDLMKEVNSTNIIPNQINSHIINML